VLPTLVDFVVLVTGTAQDGVVVGTLTTGVVFTARVAVGPAGCCSGVTSVATRISSVPTTFSSVARVIAAVVVAGVSAVVVVAGFGLQKFLW
jgi:hypothetical protein